ncbi:GNAT family N-acetyltransferase [Rheinheimera mangrovi]|uniref:GNAT family N-acetyltransferase n=1 Tax=Rheinheimera mangrovi TaxID=2498451 RepID=UPI000F8C51A9|nr:GNAT family N-acetyltransferase [Rheinheimera mangrovi]
MTIDIQLHPYTSEDLPFLYRLYASTRQQEMQFFPFDEAQKQAFLHQQFQAQLQHYTQHYNKAKFFIVRRNNIAVGRLFLDQWQHEIRIVDISLLPEFQQQGIGSWLFQFVFERAAAAQLSVSIHVEQHNPVRSWYEKLGFKYKSQTNEVYLLMEWIPDDKRSTLGL